MSYSPAGVEWIKLEDFSGNGLYLLEPGNAPGPIDVVKFDLGYPTVREVSRSVPFFDGEQDDTELHGSRVVTLDFNIYGSKTLSPNVYAEKFREFIHPNSRWFIRFKREYFNSARRILVRADSISEPMEAGRMQYVSISSLWKAPTGRIEADELSEVTVLPGLEVPIGGREYDLQYDRLYENTGPAAAVNAHNNGSSRSPINVQIFGPVTSPAIYNDTTNTAYVFNNGFQILSGDYVEIDSAKKTVLLNGNINESVMHHLDFEQTSWWDMSRGTNYIRFASSSFNVPAQARILWRANYI